MERVTVIMAEEDYRKVKDGCIDMEATIAYLKTAEKFLCEIQQLTL
jgi:hypothetical protein